MQISEFIDTYSDDIIYLQEGRAALLTHPLRNEVKELCDASFCRMFAVIMIGSIEAMLQEWRKRDRGNILSAYFTKKKRVSNKTKIHSLYNAFRKAGINVDIAIFDDYLAIKYLRNAIVHSDWKNEGKEWIEQRHFPTDTRRLTQVHYKRMQFINQNMMFYIALTGIADPSKKPSNEVIKLKEVLEKDNLVLVRKGDIPRIFWSNLERISEYVYKDIEEIVLTEKYNWTKGFSIKKIKEMPHDERKRLFYLAARKAGKDNFHLLTQHRELAREALGFWREYWQLTFNQNRISCEDMTTSIEILSNLHKRGIYPINQLLLPDGIPLKTASRLIHEMLKGYKPLTEEQIIFAHNIGRSVYHITPNITALYLLVVQLPIIDPENTEAYLGEGEKALLAMELHDCWYSYVERKNSPDPQKWTLYRQMLNEFHRNC